MIEKPIAQGIESELRYFMENQLFSNWADPGEN